MSRHKYGYIVKGHPSYFFDNGIKDGALSHRGKKGVHCWTNDLSSSNGGQWATGPQWWAKADVNCIAFAVSKPSFMPSPFIGLLLRSRNANNSAEVIEMSMSFALRLLYLQFDLWLLIRNHDVEHETRNWKNCLIDKWYFIDRWIWEEVIYGVIWLLCNFFRFLSC